MKSLNKTKKHEKCYNDTRRKQYIMLVRKTKYNFFIIYLMH